MTNGTHTFLFADISGYSLLTELDGDEAAADVALALVEVATALAPRHGARLVKCLGDGVMLHVQCASDAVELGLDLLERWRQDPSLPPVHIGVHSGPALERAGDWWGATVNVAARVTTAAGAGQLLLTDATRAAAGRFRTARLDGAGRVRLKNITSPITVYEAFRETALAA